MCKGKWESKKKIRLLDEIIALRLVYDEVHTVPLIEVHACTYDSRKSGVRKNG